MIIKKSDLKLIPANEHSSSTAEDVDFSKIDASMLTNIMLDRMTEMGGVALSAPQVGLDMSMFVMGIDQARIEVFNPSIISYSKDETLMNEGSLTYPGISVIVKRPSSISVQYYNKNGELQQNEFQGLTARIFQHAYDHLQGTTIKDKVSKLKWDMATKRLNNYKNILRKNFLKLRKQWKNKQLAIPKEYLDSEFDFGFSTADDETVVQTPAAVVNTQDISEPIIEKLQTLEALVTAMAETVSRLENASTPLDTDEYKALIEKDVKAKLTALEKLILPLLVNLMKNPEKDTIKWPGRAPIIEKQIEKILAITRS